MERVKYKGFYRGNRVKLLADADHPEGLVKAGTVFTIKSFPPCTIMSKTQRNTNFIYGTTDDDRHVRTDAENVTKV